MNRHKTYIILLFLITLFFEGCSKKPDVIIHNDITASQIINNNYFNTQWIRTNLSSANYSIVDYNWLINEYSGQFNARLFNDNIIKWDNKFECNLFADYYKTYAAVLYYNEFYQSFAGQRQLAIGEIWYIPNWAVRGEGHAINFAITERGLIFIEPQTQKQVYLTKAEISSIYFIEM